MKQFLFWGKVFFTSGEFVLEKLKRIPGESPAPRQLALEEGKHLFTPLASRSCRALNARQWWQLILWASGGRFASRLLVAILRLNQSVTKCLIKSRLTLSFSLWRNSSGQQLHSGYYRVNQSLHFAAPPIRGDSSLPTRPVISKRSEWVLKVSITHCPFLCSNNAIVSPKGKILSLGVARSKIGKCLKKIYL